MSMTISKLRDDHGNFTLVSEATPPTSGRKGYATSCIFQQNDAVTPGAALYLNIGTPLSCNFVPLASVSAMLSFSIPFNAAQFVGATAGMWGWVAPVACVVSYARMLLTAIGAVGNAQLFKHIAAATVAPNAIHNGVSIFRLLSNNTNAGWDATQTKDISVAGVLISAATTFAAGDKLAVGCTGSQSATGTLAGLVTITAYPL